MSDGWEVEVVVGRDDATAREVFGGRVGRVVARRDGFECVLTLDERGDVSLTDSNGSGTVEAPRVVALGSPDGLLARTLRVASTPRVRRVDPRAEGSCNCCHERAGEVWLLDLRSVRVRLCDACMGEVVSCVVEDLLGHPLATVDRLRRERDRLRDEVVALRGDVGCEWEPDVTVEFGERMRWRCARCERVSDAPVHAYFDPCPGGTR